MSVSDLLKAHMDAVRGVSCAGDKLSISRATQELDIIAGTENKLLATPPFVETSQPGAVSTGDNASQTLSVHGKFFELLPKDGFYVPVVKGDKVKQAITIKADKELPLFYMSFFGTKSGHHQVKTNLLQIDDNKYRVSAEYTFAQNESVRAFDFYNDKLEIVGEITLTLSQPFLGIVHK